MCTSLWVLLMSPVTCDEIIKVNSYFQEYITLYTSYFNFMYLIYRYFNISIKLLSHITHEPSVVIINKTLRRQLVNKQENMRYLLVQSRHSIINEGGFHILSIVMSHISAFSSLKYWQLSYDTNEESVRYCWKI